MKIKKKSRGGGGLGSGREGGGGGGVGGSRWMLTKNLVFLWKLKKIREGGRVWGYGLGGPIRG